MALRERYIKAILGGFNPMNVESEEEARVSVENVIGSPEVLDAVRKIIVDDKTTWAEKADYWIQAYHPTEEESLELFKSAWRVLSNDQPWPLDE